ncbi:MAG: TatD family hydrolase [Myxococcales bacterium]|nr:TatD family hydrolase [Myxococcales bacterium]
MSLVDIAGNLTNKAFREDLPAVLERAAGAGVSLIVVAGVSTTTSHRGWEMASDHRSARNAKLTPLELVATSGIHPHHASQASSQALVEVADLAHKDLVVAIGECGLDYNRDFSPRDAQRRAFEAQLEIASGTSKPVYLHERDAHEDFTKILERWRPKLAGGLVHCFTGDRKTLERYLAMDLHIGFTGWLCDERRGQHLRELVRLVPRGRIMVETDCPYILPRDMSPKPKSGRNEPAFVAHVARAVAEARGDSFEDLAAHTTATARSFFGLPLRPGLDGCGRSSA